MAQMTYPEPISRQAARIGYYGAVTALFGIVASGPAALAIVTWVRPQPPWVDADTYVEHFHLIQLLPFLTGLFLVAGFVAIIASIHVLWTSQARPALSHCALAAVTVFATLIGLNYVMQLGFIPALVQEYDAANGPLIAAFSMAHSGSLAWALEMWGYACLGTATWLVGPYFVGEGRRAVARWAFIANGPVSIMGALGSIIRPGWELTMLGLTGFALWNVLALVVAISALLCFVQTLQDDGGTTDSPPSGGSPWARFDVG